MSDEKQSDVLRDEIAVLRDQLAEAKVTQQQVEQGGAEALAVASMTVERDRLKAEIAVIQAQTAAAQGRPAPDSADVPPDVPPGAPAPVAEVAPVAAEVPPAVVPANGKPATDTPSGR